MRINLKKLYKFLFFLGIFFIPFNSYVGISALGEFRKDSAAIFFLLSSLFFLLEVGFGKKIKIPINNIFFQFIIIFTFFLFASGVGNFTSIYENYFKQTSGVSRFVRQIGSLIVSIVFFITAYNIFSNYKQTRIFFVIRRVILYSFFVVSLYSSLEILIIIFKFENLKPIFLLFNYFPFTETSLDYNFKRISSVSYEPPFLAIYLITIAGWMFSYILTSKEKKKYIPTIIVIALTFFSGSRTALIVILIQFFVFIKVTFSTNINFQKIIRKSLFLLFFLFSILFIFKGNEVIKQIQTKIETLNFKKNLTTNVSNKTRFGIQYTSLLVFLENPIIGVGFGQQAYHSINKYPKWAIHNNYEFKQFYLNERDKSFPPGYNIFTRLLAEIGIIGFFIFTFFLFSIFYQCILLIRKRRDTEKIISIVLLISFLGFTINWLQFDSFRIFGFWICLALLILQIQQKKYENKQ